MEWRGEGGVNHCEVGCIGGGRERKSRGRYKERNKREKNNKREYKREKVAVDIKREIREKKNKRGKVAVDIKYPSTERNPHIIHHTRIQVAVDTQHTHTINT